MSNRDAPTLVAPSPQAVSGLAALAFGDGGGGAPVGRSLAFLPPEALDLDLDDPEQRDFGDYELLAQLGQGGMGVVYRAHQRSLDREVALKLLAAGPWAAPAFIERFRREAQSAARMQHPNIVPIYEIGSHAELNFFTMALVRGESLAQRIDRGGPLPPAEAARLVRRIAEALDYAHRLGILHLDLKPANVLVDAGGEPHVADFGLSKRVDESLDADGDEVSGTPSYMAPEQAMGQGNRIGVATDLYGLGAILYELVSGRPPFLAATPRLTLEQVVVGELVPPSTLNAAVPSDLDAICTTCLARDAGARYPSARALADDLGRFLEGREVSVRPLGRAERLRRWARREPRLATAIGAAFLTLLVGVLATSTQWRRAQDHLSAAMANAERAQQNLWAARTQSAEAAVAAGDGFAALRPLSANLVEMEADGRVELAGLERERIGQVLAGAPQLVDLIQLGDGQSIGALALSPDGRQLAVASHASPGERWLRLFDVASGRELWAVSTVGLTRVMPFAHDIPHAYLRFSPDGRQVLVGLMQQAPFASPTATDNMAFDVRDGKHLLPAGLDPAPVDVVYSDDVAVGLVRFRSDPSSRFPDAGQFFRVPDWQPIGPRHRLDAARTGDQWLPSPDGSTWLGSSDFIEMRLFAAGSLAPLWRLTLPDAQPARAWRFDRAGRWLALGTTAGQVHLVDARDGSHSPLSPSLPATVRWLEFGADGTLLAAAEDGSMLVWDIATGLPRAAPLVGPGLSPQWAARLIDGQIFRMFGHQLGHWRLPPAAPFDNRAVPAMAKLRSARGFHADAYDLHPPTRLLASGDQSGRIALWRLPPPVLQQHLAAPLPPRTQAFDGARLVAVDGREVRLVDAVTALPVAAALRHPEVVRFAELSAGGRHLVTIAGRTLRVLDPVDGRLRGAALALPQAPLRVELATDAQLLALTVAEYAGDQLQERILIVDLDAPNLREPSPTVPGPLQEFALDPKGRYLLLRAFPHVAPDAGVRQLALQGEACTALDAATAGHYFGLAVSGDGERVWVATSLPQRRIALQHWQIGECRLLARHEIPTGQNTPVLLALGDELLVHRLTAEAIGRFGAAGTPPLELRVAPDRTMAAIAASGDGRRLALATRDAVQIVDLQRGQRIGLPLAAPIGGHDAIAKLAFGPDGSRLLGRTVRGRWLVWSLAPAEQPAQVLAGLARLLDPQASEMALQATDMPALQALLGAARPSLQAPAAEAPAPMIELAPLPAVAADTRFIAVDLAPAHNVPLNGEWPRSPGMSGDLPTLAPGPQRLLGIDWLLEGGVQLSSGGAAAALHPTLPRSAVVALPRLPARRLHLLLAMHIPMSPQQSAHATARVVLVAADGRRVALPIYTRRHVVTGLMPHLAEPGARVGFVGISATAVRGGTYSSSHTLNHVYAVALDLPAGLGPLATLQFEVGDGDMEAPLFYAATLERADVAGAPEDAGHVAGRDSP